MGSTILTRAAVLTVCLLVVSAFIYTQPPEPSVSKPQRLSNFIKKVGDWEPARDQILTDNIVSALELDDYLFRTFYNKGQYITLYIGYYYTSKKLSAAHSPLVCYPGQGWGISIPKTVKIKTEAGIINMETAIASKGEDKELVLYWLQAWDQTSSGPFKQKLLNLVSRISNNREDNAFIRVSISLTKIEPHVAHRIGQEFIEDFYPLFLTFVTS